MSKVARADAHIHLFEGGFQGGSFTARPGVAIDETTCYQALAKDHNIEAALVVGYAAAPWCRENNLFLEKAAARHTWVRPLAFVGEGDGPEKLETWRDAGFAGVTFYVFDEPTTQRIAGLPTEFWQWLIDRRWLVSVNSRGESWQVWEPVLERFPELRLLISHLGLPPRVSTPPSPVAARTAMKDVLALGRFPGPRIKLSGLYALTEPAHAYPHQAAEPYIEATLETFGAERLLWASDFSPHLDFVSFPQAVDAPAQFPCLTGATQEKVRGGNLLQLLREIDGRAS